MNTPAVDTTSLSTMKLRSAARGVETATDLPSLRSLLLALRSRGEPYELIGGGSNSLFAPEIGKTLVLMGMPGISYKEEGSDVLATAGAGVVWDTLVADTVSRGLSGLEALSGIPGSVGATPIQNVGAYGAEVSERIVIVEAYDIERDAPMSFTPDECGFAYRTSKFKNEWAGRFAITSVTFRLSANPPVMPAYPGVREKLEEWVPVTPQAIRDAVLEIRWSKLPKPELVPNVGSFFHNPIVDAGTAEKLLARYPDMKIFDAESGTKKLAAGWLIEAAGWKGKDLGPVGMYEKNALVMVNKGDARLADVLMLEDAVRVSVRNMFGVELVREPSVIA